MAALGWILGIGAVLYVVICVAMFFTQRQLMYFPQKLDPARELAEAKQLIRQFQDKFSELMEDETDSDVIYQMQIQFFPLTREVRANEITDARRTEIVAAPDFEMGTAARTAEMG